jgi:hypothetical protein
MFTFFLLIYIIFRFAIFAKAQSGLWNMEHEKKCTHYNRSINSLYLFSRFLSASLFHIIMYMAVRCLFEKGFYCKQRAALLSCCIA